MLPRHFPLWLTIYSRLARWRWDGTLRTMDDRRRMLARGPKGEPARRLQLLWTVTSSGRVCGSCGVITLPEAHREPVGPKRHDDLNPSCRFLFAHAQPVAEPTW